jgi:phosphonate transport system permease protein
VDRVSAAAIPRRPSAWPLVAGAFLVALAATAAVLRLHLDVSDVFTARTMKYAAETFERLWPPRVDDGTLAAVRRGFVETLSMSVVGTLLGALIGLALMPFCCETLLVRGGIVDEEDRPFALRLAVAAAHHGARLAANVLRTVPYFVWALLFLLMVGQGMFPCTLAIAAHSGGVIARNYAQSLDAVDLRPSAALRAAGARRSHVFLYGMLPAARSALASFTLYRWEVNIRESAVLGLVGNVGLGFHLTYSIGIFDWRAAATHLAAIMVLVLAVDALSARIRRSLL